ISAMESPGTCPSSSKRGTTRSSRLTICSLSSCKWLEGDFFWTTLGCNSETELSDACSGETDRPNSISRIGTEKARRWMLGATGNKGTDIDHSFLSERFDVEVAELDPSVVTLQSEMALGPQ